MGVHQGRSGSGRFRRKNLVIGPEPLGKMESLQGPETSLGDERSHLQRDPERIACPPVSGRRVPKTVWLG